MKIMAIRVVEFLSGGTKLERKYPRINIPIGNYWILIIGVMGRLQKLPTFDFQSQIFNVKNHWNLSQFFFL